MSARRSLLTEPSTGIFILLFCIPAVLFNLASFYNIAKPSSSMVKAIAIAVGFAALEYVFKVPIIEYGYNNGITPFFMNVSWVILTLGMAYVASHLGWIKEPPKHV